MGQRRLLCRECQCAAMGPNWKYRGGGSLACRDDWQTYLKVLVLCGYYDVATPFNGIENTFAHMNLEPPRKNVSFACHEGGHMMYIDEVQHHKLHKDIVMSSRGLPALT